MSFFHELKRRNVFKVAIAYAIAAWLLIEITATTFPILKLPDWTVTLVTALVLIAFPLTLIFAWAFELTPEGIKKEKDVDRAESITHVTGRKLDFMIIGAMAIAILFLLTDKFPFNESPETGVGEIASTGQSIAVLPFVNISSDAEQEYFSDGITEEILNSLASVKELKVAGRTSSFAFKGENQDLRRIGELLGVEHILEGSVRKSGTKVRITAQLVQVEDGFHLWSDTYDRELTDVFAIQDEIATEILNQLKARLLDEDQVAIVSQRTDPEVYDLYLLAKQRIYDRTRLSIESATELLDRAIARDPDYAPAYAQRGIATLLLSERDYGTIPEAEAQVQGRRFLDAALEKDPQLAEAWAGLGLYHTDEPSEHEQAIAALTKALSINPNLINASHWLQIALGRSGEPRAARQILAQMTERDPLHAPGLFSAVSAFNLFGQEDKAQALIDRFRSFKPNNHQLMLTDAMHHYFKGSPAEALRLAEQAYELAPTDEIARFWVTLGLRQTLQLERVAEEGVDFLQVDALDLLGREDAAFELALSLSKDGDPWSLFALYNRADRSQELIDHLEERWPGLDSFAADHPQNQHGYGLMAEVALAYFRTGNRERFNNALLRVASAVSKLSEQGVDNFQFMFENAKYLALAKEYDRAITQLELAVDRGYRDYALFATITPIFEPLHDDPRYVAVRDTMIAKVNVERETLGLKPIDPSSEPWF
jgi:TolB-like protein/Tfp pilus assembly protein PilF